MTRSSKKSLTYNKKVIKSFYGWTFWDYVSPADNNKIEEWRQKDLFDEGRLMFDKLISQYRKIENHLEWAGFKRKPFIQGDDRIWEIRFVADGRQTRVLLTFHREKSAVLLMGCYHKGPNYQPPNAIEEAFRRKKLLASGEASHAERKDRTA